MCPLGVWWIQFVGPYRALKLFGVKLVGINWENGKKLLFTFIFVAAVLVIAAVLRWISARVLAGRQGKRVTFWSHQGIRLLEALLLLLGFLSVWFSDPSKLEMFAGLVTAGLAFALQKVVTAFAGYLVILRGKTFNVGDRITMGGVRGDVVALGFIQTTIMEMGQPPAVSDADPAMWVAARQYTGRLVTVTNDKIFDTPIYNYTRNFPYIWEEMHIPISYKDDRRRAEQILLSAAEELTVKYSELGEEALRELERRYVMKRSDMKPRVYMRLTDNWVELAVRFLVMDHGVREVKDAMSRRIIDALDQAHIGVASGTYEIVGVPPIHVVQDRTIPPPQSAPPALV